MPGLTFALPFIDTIAYKRSLKEKAIPIRPQTAITKDNVHVQVQRLMSPHATRPSLRRCAPRHPVLIMCCEAGATVALLLCAAARQGRLHARREGV